jgi:2-polyprenyl-3-methyl-5-hydroxy-6-metoxy-1,4-benzoquinol methylase
MSESYHRFVFDSRRRRFVGQFEEMYRRESVEGYDSWHQENLDTLARRVSIAMLADRAYPRILDVGCGKGAFTSLLKTETNHVVGIDVSSTAIAKAAERYPGIDFRTGVTRSQRSPGSPRACSSRCTSRRIQSGS